MHVTDFTYRRQSSICSLVVAFCILASLLQQSPVVERLGNKSRSTSQPPVPSKNSHHEHCVSITSENTYVDDLLPFGWNSRVLCVKNSPTCFGPNSIQLYNNSRLTCSKLSSSLDRFEKHNLDCNKLRDYVHCAHGVFEDIPTKAKCPDTLLESNLDDPRYLHGTTIVVPAYPFLGNIFHFAHVINHLSHVVASLSSLFPHKDFDLSHHVHIVFRGENPVDLTSWNSFMFSVMQERMKDLNVSLHLNVLAQSNQNTRENLQRSICTESSVLLGYRGNENTWPFPTGEEMNPFTKHSQFSSVPIESVTLRKSAYKLAGFKTALPQISRGTLGAPLTAWADIPPLVIGYASRNDASDPPPGQPLGSMNTRRFLDSDEAWLLNVLEREAFRIGGSVRTIKTPHTMPVEDQVRAFAEVGIIVGIHGANLMNTIFSPPFSALVEITYFKLPCYVAGANSGLTYWRHDTSRIATAEESSCGLEDNDRCRVHEMHRRMVVDDSNSRTEVPKLVREAATHIQNIRGSFEHLGKIPLILDRKHGTYRIDWTRAKNRTSDLVDKILSFSRELEFGG